MKEESFKINFFHTLIIHIATLIEIRSYYLQAITVKIIFVFFLCFINDLFKILFKLKSRNSIQLFVSLCFFFLLSFHLFSVFTFCGAKMFVEVIPGLLISIESLDAPFESLMGNPSNLSLPMSLRVTLLSLGFMSLLLRTYLFFFSLFKNLAFAATFFSLAYPLIIVMFTTI